MDYQLIVIGAGPGGYTAALRAARLGLHTAVVERREVGGTCLNRGCIPTKTLLHASQVYHDAVNGAGMGVHGSVTYDIGEMFAFKRSVSEKLRSGIHALLKGAKVDVIEGTAQIAAKATRDSQGVAVVTLKKNQTIASVVPADTLELANPHRYRVRSLPATGALIRAEDEGEQMSLL